METDSFIQDTEKEKEEKSANPVQYYVKFSFTVTYILLLTTATITFIEAMRTKYPYVRHVLNLETAISVIAGYFYSVFVTKIEEYGKADKKIDWADITITRYIDWSITTPLMLLTLCIVLSANVNKTIHAGTMLSITALNYMMLYLGYLGETKALSRITAMFYSFIAFFAMFSMIFVNFVLPKYRLDNYILFGLYFSIWSLYGVVYLCNEEYKNIAMNILDATAKCLIGLGLWLYYAEVIKL